MKVEGDKDLGIKSGSLFCSFDSANANVRQVAATNGEGKLMAVLFKMLFISLG